MKRLILLVLLSMLLVLALSACGSSAEEPAVEEPAAEESPAEESPAEEPAEEKEVVETLECTDEIGCIEVAPGDPIQLASALVISGPNTELGLDSQWGVELAIEFFGDVLGHPVELQAEDDGCSAEGGQTSAQKIVSNPDIVAMVGTSCSGAGVPAAKIITDAGYVMVSPSNTAPALTDPELHEAGYLRTAHNDKIQGRAMAEFAFNELGVTKAAAIHDGDPYTEGLASVFTAAFEELGGEIVAFEAEAADATNVEPLLTSVAAAGPEFIYYPVFIPLGSLLTNTAAEIEGLEGVILAGADGVQSPSFLENTTDTSEGMYVSGPDLSFSNTFYEEEFLPAYQENFGTEPTAPFHAHAYDATVMVLKAIEESAQLGADGTILIGRQALRDALFATSGLEGITGTLTCDEYGDCADPKIAISQVQGGDFVPVSAGGAEEAAEEEGMADDGPFECTDEIGCVEVAPGDPILLASALVISGPNTELGLDSQWGVEIAIDFYGEVLGHPVELQAEDDGCSAEGGQTSAQKIVSNPDIVAMVGTSCSGAGVPAAKIITDAGYAMVSPSNTSPALTDPELHEAGYLRTAHNDKIQGRAMAEFAFNELGVTKAAAIHDGDPYTEGLASVFAAAFEELGGEIVAFEAEAADATNVEPLLTSVAAAGPEFIYYPVFIPLGSLLTNTAADIEGLDGVILAGADGVQSPSFLENTADTSEGMYVSGPDLSFSNSFYEDEFLPAYMEMFGTEPTAPFHAHAYDATVMVLDAIVASAKQDADGTLLIGRQALRDALFATSGMEGITGTLSCDEYGDCADPKIAISQVQGGEFVPVSSD